MNEESKRVLADFEEASQQGWLRAAELEAIRQEIEAKGLSPGRTHCLRRQIMQVLQRQAPDEQSKLLVNWADQAMRSLASASGPATQTRVYFTPGDACHGAVLRCLDAARASLDICLFTITDDRITDGILRAAKRGVRVRIITDDEKAWDPGSDVYLLAATGLPVKKDFSADHMHHKFAVVDDRQVITGSFNWTKGSSNNYENILICVEPLVTAAYRQEFDRLWDIMDPVRTS